MLVAYRLAGLSALGAHYAGVRWRAMWGTGVGSVRSLAGNGGKLRRLNGAEPAALRTAGDGNFPAPALSGHRPARPTA